MQISANPSFNCLITEIIDVYNFKLLLTILYRRKINAEKTDSRQSLTILWNQRAHIGITFLYFTSTRIDCYITILNSNNLYK